MGGRESRIRCLAHIIALVANSVFNSLAGGSRKEAEERFHTIMAGEGSLSFRMRYFERLHEGQIDHDFHDFERRAQLRLGKDLLSKASS